MLKRHEEGEALGIPLNIALTNNCLRHEALLPNCLSRQTLDVAFNKLTLGGAARIDTGTVARDHQYAASRSFRC